MASNSRSPDEQAILGQESIAVTQQLYAPLSTQDARIAWERFSVLAEDVGGNASQYRDPV